VRAVSKQDPSVQRFSSITVEKCAIVKIAEG
jgi:hypothetical protein